VSSGTRDSRSETPLLDDARWRRSGDTVVLIGSRCSSCGVTAFPAADGCGSCGAGDAEPVELSTYGTLSGYTTIHVASGRRPAPYTVGYVDFPEPVRVFGQIAVPEPELTVGLPVTCELGVVCETADGDAVISYRFIRA
jgi:hypothetical protein